MSDVCIIGLGSPHGDDQLGWELVRLLENEGVQSSVETPLRITACATLGGEVLECWKGADLAIIVDAVRGALPPGTVRHIILHPQHDLSEVDAVRTLTSHSIDLRALMDLAMALDEIPTRVVLIGVEVEACAPFESMSAPACAALPGLVRAVRAEISAFSGND